MNLNQIANEGLKHSERTLEEEIEISELAQKISLFDKEMKSSKKDYKEAKREVIERINSLRQLEKKAQTKIVFKDNYLHVEKVISKLNDLELQIKNSALVIEEVDKYDFDSKLKRKVFRTQYFIKERGSSSKNSEEERLLKFLNQKEKMVSELAIFSKCFNSLTEIKRKLLYHSLFKEETTIKVAESLGYAGITITRFKKEAIVELIDFIMELEFK